MSSLDTIITLEKIDERFSKTFKEAHKELLSNLVSENAKKAIAVCDALLGLNKFSEKDELALPALPALKNGQLEANFDSVCRLIQIAALYSDHLNIRNVNTLTIEPGPVRDETTEESLINFKNRFDQMVEKKRFLTFDENCNEHFQLHAINTYTLLAFLLNVNCAAELDSLKAALFKTTFSSSSSSTTSFVMRSFKHQTQTITLMRAWLTLMLTEQDEEAQAIIEETFPFLIELYIKNANENGNGKEKEKGVKLVQMHSLIAIACLTEMHMRCKEISNPKEAIPKYYDSVVTNTNNWLDKLYENKNRYENEIETLETCLQFFTKGILPSLSFNINLGSRQKKAPQKLECWHQITLYHYLYDALGSDNMHTLLGSSYYLIDLFDIVVKDNLFYRYEYPKLVKRRKARLFTQQRKLDRDVKKLK